MANYEINLTATQIEAALNKAHSPATAVDTTQNLVESGAIKSYVDTQVSAGAAITTASFAGSALEDADDGLTATDTAVPTSKAVSEAIDAKSVKIAQLSTVDNTSATLSSSIIAPFTISSDPSNIISVDSNGVITVAEAGIYQIALKGEFRENDNSSSDYYKVQILLDSSSVAEIVISETGYVYEPKTLSSTLLLSTSDEIKIRFLEIGASWIAYRNVEMYIIKFP